MTLTGDGAFFLGGLCSGAGAMLFVLYLILRRWEDRR